MSKIESPGWVRPLRVTTPDEDVIHGAMWPDGRVFVWAPFGPWTEAWGALDLFDEAMREKGCTVEWAPGPAGEVSGVPG